MSFSPNQWAEGAIDVPTPNLSPGASHSDRPLTLWVVFWPLPPTLRPGSWNVTGGRGLFQTGVLVLYSSQRRRVLTPP